ncbi:hypothetical protein MBLNU459_g4907t1 [Dothideomycetes sp. NU459]
MTTNRPFFSNFLAAFRAHSATLPKSSPSISTSASAAAAAAAASAGTVWTSNSTTNTQQTSSPSAASAPRSINAKSASQNVQPGPGQTAVVPLHSTLSPLQHNVSPLTHGPRSPPSPSSASPVYGPPNRPSPSYPTPHEARRARRGSDSSSEGGGGGGGGYRDVLGAEKWYIGGRTATGEEKYYKLSMVRRDRSADRLSADRLSL